MYTRGSPPEEDRCCVHVLPISSEALWGEKRKILKVREELRLGTCQSTFFSCFWRRHRQLQCLATLRRDTVKKTRIMNFVQISMVERYLLNTVNPQKRPAGLILSLRVQMRVLLEFGPNLGIFAYCFLSFLRVLLEYRSYSRVGLFWGFTVFQVG